MSLVTGDFPDRSGPAHSRRRTDGGCETRFGRALQRVADYLNPALHHRDVLGFPRQRNESPEAGRRLASEEAQRAGAGPDRSCHSRLIKPNTHESDTSPFTTQSSRKVPSRTNPSFSRTRAEATLRVSVSA